VYGSFDWQTLEEQARMVLISGHCRRWRRSGGHDGLDPVARDSALSVKSTEEGTRDRSDRVAIASSQNRVSYPRLERRCMDGVPERAPERHTRESLVVVEMDFRPVELRVRFAGEAQVLMECDPGGLHHTGLDLALQKLGCEIDLPVGCGQRVYRRGAPVARAAHRDRTVERRAGNLAAGIPVSNPRVDHRGGASGVGIRGEEDGDGSSPHERPVSRWPAATLLPDPATRLVGLDPSFDQPKCSSGQCPYVKGVASPVDQQSGDIMGVVSATRAEALPDAQGGRGVVRSLCWRELEWPSAGHQVAGTARELRVWRGLKARELPGDPRGIADAEPSKYGSGMSQLPPQRPAQGLNERPAFRIRLFRRQACRFRLG
jgi:hypothetical protein